MLNLLRRHSVIAIAISLILLGLAVISALAGGTSNRSGLDFGDSLYERTSLDEAQPRLSFRILQPTMLPQGYVLALVQIPREQSDHLLLVYTSSTQPGRDFVIGESPAAAQLDRVALSRNGSTQQITVAGHPAIYVKGVVSQKQGEAASAIDENGHELFVEWSGVWVHLIGWRNAGVDLEMIKQVAASLR